MPTLHQHCVQIVARRFPAFPWPIEVEELGGGHGQSVTIVADGFSIIFSDDDFGFTLLGWIHNDRLAAPPYRVWIEFAGDFFDLPPVGEEPRGIRLDQKEEWFERLVCQAVDCVERLGSSPAVWFDIVRAYEKNEERDQ